MNPTKWRISKACQECRTKKIKCNGQTPCEGCKVRSLNCVYREKARNRMRKSKPRIAAYEAIMSQETRTQDSIPPDDSETASPSVVAPTPIPEGVDPGTVAPGSIGASEQSIKNYHTSVAATHRASPSCLLQLYYGPSSNFALLNSIYHQIEGTREKSPPREGMEEGGPGLDLFSHRKLFFGDLADNQRSSALAEGSPAMLLDPVMAKRFLERYLLTYWHGLPVFDKDTYRRRLDSLFRPPGILDFDAPETIVIVLAMALGASMLGEEAASEFLFQKAKLGAAKLDEVVNMHVVQIHLMMGHYQSERARPNSCFLHTGSAVRKAVAAGLHKPVSVQQDHSAAEIEQRRILFWSLYFWETWSCFIVGRPSSIPDPGSNIPVPSNQKLLVSLVTLSRIMAKCVRLIYSPRHDSLLPVWNAATEIRRELHRFAEKQSKDMKFGLVGDASTGELGVCQAMVSTMYHHTLLLTFRPFLILRAKLKRDTSSSGGGIPDNNHTPPPWLDAACEYCLEAARNSIGFLTGSCATNTLCNDIKYHGFFIEGACYALAFDMLQESKSAHRNLPWIHSGLRCLRSMIARSRGNTGQLPITTASIEQMVRYAFPNLELGDDEQTEARKLHSQQSTPTAMAETSSMLTANGTVEAPTFAFTFPSMPFGFDVAGGMNGTSPSSGMRSDDQIDFTAADVGWDIDFGTMDMEAFLSLDTNQSFNFAS